MEGCEICASCEICQRPKTTLVGFEGPGGTGKTELADGVWKYLRDLSKMFAHPLSTRIITEPPKWDIEGFVPHKFLTSREMASITVAFLNAAWRRMRYMGRGAYFDGEELELGLYDFLQDPFGVLLSDRIFLSSIVYQGFCPGGGLQGKKKLFAVLHEGIPFPDLLFIIMDNLEDLIARLLARGDGDIYDRTELQAQIYRGYQYVIDMIHNIPGVYVIESRKPVYESLFNLKDLDSSSLLIALRVLAANIEKSGQIPIFPWNAERSDPREGILRVQVLPGVSAYVFMEFAKGCRHLMQRRWEGLDGRGEYIHEYALGKSLPIINGDLALGDIGRRHYCLMAIESWEQLAKSYPPILEPSMWKTKKGVSHVLDLTLRPFNEVHGTSIDLGYLGDTVNVPDFYYSHICTPLSPSTHCGTAVYGAHVPSTVDEVVRNYLLN